MLAPERERLKRSPLFWIASIIILVLIILSFVVAPALVGLGPDQDTLTFGSYAGRPITYEYGNYFFRQRERIASQWTQEVTDANYQWVVYQIWRTAFNNTVIYKDLMHRADQAGFQVTGDRVDRFLLTSGPYINAQGQFDRELYANTPLSRRQEIAGQVRDEILQQQLITDMLETYATDGEADFIFSFSQTEKRFDYVYYPFTDLPGDMVLEFVESRPMLFSQIDVSTITLRDNLSEAQAVRERIASGEITFEEAARTYSIDVFAQDGGMAGWKFYHDLRTEFADEADLEQLFSLGRDELSDLYPHEFGYVLYQVNNPPREPNLDDELIVSDIRSYIIRNERALVEDYFLDKGMEFAAASESEGFDVAAASFSKTVYSTDFSPLNYRASMLMDSLQASDTQRLLSRAESDPFALTELFRQDEGGITKPLVIGNGVAVAVCREVRQQNDEELAFLRSLYPFYVREIEQDQLYTTILESDKLEDNFINVFFSVIM